MLRITVIFFTALTNRRFTTLFSVTVLRGGTGKSNYWSVKIEYYTTPHSLPVTIALSTHMLAGCESGVTRPVSRVTTHFRPIPVSLHGQYIIQAGSISPAEYTSSRDTWRALESNSLPPPEVHLCRIQL